jgi:hypothetical protein
LQDDIVDISSREEQARQENPTLGAPRSPVTTIDTLVNLQDPILETLENLATTVDTLVNLQDLQEPIVTSSAINPSQEKVCYIFEPFASSFPCTVLISAFFYGLNLLKLLSFDPASVSSAILEADDHRSQPTGVASQLLRIKDLLSAPIDTLVQGSDEVR